MTGINTAERVLYVFADAAAVLPEAGGSILRLLEQGGEATVIYGLGEEGEDVALEQALAAIGVESVWFLDGDPSTELPVVIGPLGVDAVVIGGIAPGNSAALAVQQAAINGAALARIPAHVVTPIVETAQDAASTQIDIRGVRAKKWEAVQHYLAAAARPALEGGAAELPTVENFVTLRAAAAAPSAPASLEQRPSIGSRILSCILALGVGMVFGALGTVMHSEVWVIGDARLPWGLVLSLVAVGALFASLRIILGGRLVPACAALGVLGTVFLLSLRSSGGSVLVSDGLLGQVWAIAPALLAVLVLAWPEFSTAKRPLASATAAVGQAPRA